jgi:two-component system response regulator PilR (NtrC family)
MSRLKILIVDDEASLREMLTIFFKKLGHQTAVAASFAEGRALASRDEFDAILCDIKMPDGSGIDLLPHFKETQPRAPVMMITAHASHEDAVEAMRRGAADYIGKPFDIDELAVKLEKAVARRELEAENLYLKQELADRYSFANIIGKNSRMREIFNLIRRIEKVSSTVLISGESGTGKELIARAIHFSSTRKNGKFVSINCGALPEMLLESELFGHEKGSFTGAIREKKGLFAEADGGTLFLDEISETSPAMQVKLLRVLQDRAIRKVGGTEEQTVDVRIIAATNRDLAALVAEGKFREDLFYRINVIPVTLPPLRARVEDIPLLAEHFIRKICGDQHIPEKNISAEAMRLLEIYPWPGNVRALENTLERTVALEPGPVITTRSLPAAVAERTSARLPEIESLPAEGVDLEAYLEAVGKRLMRQALERCNGVQTQAAELLKMSFRSFRYYAKKYDLLKREELYSEADAAEN